MDTFLNGKKINLLMLNFNILLHGHHFTIIYVHGCRINTKCSCAHQMYVIKYWTNPIMHNVYLLYTIIRNIPGSTLYVWLF